MGYYTYFKLSTNLKYTNDERDREKDIINEFRSENQDAHEALDEEGDTNECWKWYNAKDDIKAFSKRHPDILFELSGEGEGVEDFWICYVQDGKSQTCNGRVVYPPYDPIKMT